MYFWQCKKYNLLIEYIIVQLWTINFLRLHILRNRTKEQKQKVNNKNRKTEPDHFQPDCLDSKSLSFFWKVFFPSTSIRTFFRIILSVYMWRVVQDESIVQTKPHGNPNSSERYVWCSNIEKKLKANYKMIDG